MSEQNEQQPAPPAPEAVTSVQPAPSAQVVEIEEEPEPEPTVHELVAEHVKADDKAHETVREHLERRGIRPLVISDPHTKQPVEILHAWQARALLARFKAAGIHEDARMPSHVFERALHETLHGRI
jgi:hypothetical protein